MVGIIILNFNKYELTISCMKSISERIDYRIYVVDNGSNAKNLEALKNKLKQFQDYVLIENKENLGFSKGMNVGVKQAIKDGCEYILFTNSDILFLPNSIRHLQLSLDQDYSIGIVGPRIIDTNGREQHFNVLKRENLFEYFLMETLISIMLPASYKRKFLMDERISYTKKDYVYSLSGCIFMMRKEDVEAICYLDEYPFLYSEEFILAEKMIQLGKKELYDGTITIKHNHQGSTTQGSAFVEKHKIRSRLYYLKKYRNTSYFYRKIIFYFMLINPLLLHKVNESSKKFYNETKRFVR